MNNKDLTFSNVLKWQQRYCVRVWRLLAPEWTIHIKRIKHPIDKEDDSEQAYVIPDANYHDADMVLSTKIKNNTVGRRLIIHEFGHLFVHDIVEKLGEKVEKEVVTKLEEQIVVKLSKIIEDLFDEQDKAKTKIRQLQANRRRKKTAKSHN